MSIRCLVIEARNLQDAIAGTYQRQISYLEASGKLNQLNEAYVDALNRATVFEKNIMHEELNRVKEMMGVSYGTVPYCR